MLHDCFQEILETGSACPVQMGPEGRATISTKGKVLADLCTLFFDALCFDNSESSLRRGEMFIVLEL